MGKFTIYDKTNGQLIKTVNCPDKSIQAQCNETEHYIDGGWDDSLYMMDLDSEKIIPKPEVPVEISKKQIVANGKVQSNLDPQVSLEEGGPDMSVRDAIKYLYREIQYIKAQIGEIHATQQ